ncbi:inosine triphosphate pyrophosphatase-like protein [Hyaloraphidium curvatum]|nr:inosine triphosphate pyrophosphatase-like protein [Hyaloraphidium curvatum]
MESKPITFVTGNAKKLEEFKAIMGSSTLQLTSQALDLPEIQGTPENVARDKCLRAAELVKGPVLTEDTSLCFNALNGLPGAYIKWFLDGLGHEGLNRMLNGFDDRSAYAQCIFSFCEGEGQEVVQFVGRTDGRIVAARGPKDFGWDPVFEPAGYDQTYAEMPKELKNSISHRGRSLAKLKEFLLARPKQ